MATNRSCGPIEQLVSYDSARFALISYVGTPIAAIGIGTNAILFVLFIQAKYRNSPTLYLCFLALLDIAICSIYVPFFTVDAVALYMRVEWLHHIWHSYVMVLYCASRIAQLASTYMVLCATVERFVLVAEISRLKPLSSALGRWIAIISVLVFALVLRLPAYWEYQIQYEATCTSFDDYMFVPILASRHDYFIYNFYVLQIIHVLLPFMLLLALNLLIIMFMYTKLKRQTDVALVRGSTSVGPLWGTTITYTASRNRLKYATWTMVAIVFTYLVCNICSVFVTVLERFGGAQNPLLFHEDGSSTMFYTYSADMISIMVVLNSFVRLAIYAGCNPEIRADLRDFLRPSKQRSSLAAAVEEEAMLRATGAGNRSHSSSISSSKAQSHLSADNSIATANCQFDEKRVKIVDFSYQTHILTDHNSGRNGIDHRRSICSSNCNIEVLTPQTVVETLM